jgi:hypothetical protein
MLNEPGSSKKTWGCVGTGLASSEKSKALPGEGEDIRQLSTWMDESCLNEVE